MRAHGLVHSESSKVLLTLSTPRCCVMHYSTSSWLSGTVLGFMSLRVDLDQLGSSQVARDVSWGWFEPEHPGRVTSHLPGALER